MIDSLLERFLSNTMSGFSEDLDNYADLCPGYCQYCQEGGHGSYSAPDS